MKPSSRTGRGRLVRRVEFRDTPKHGSWLNIAENELSSLTCQCVTGRRFADIETLAGEPPEPMLPKPDANGHNPARETMRAIMARDIIRHCRRLGLTQAELARRAGIRSETLNRIERAVRAPSVATGDRIDAALTQAEGLGD